MSGSRSGRVGSTPRGLSIRPALVAVGAFVGVRVLVLIALFAAAGHQGRSGYRVLTRWDAQWYRGIAEDGYGRVRLHEDGRLLADYAFFPLYPLTERAVSAVIGLGAVDAGLVISAVASVVAALGIFAIADGLYGARVGVVATVLWAALPIGIVQSMAYSESLFTALSVWALHATLRDRWLLAGVLACAAGLTRPVGAAVAAAVVVAAVAHALRGGAHRGPHAGSRWRPLLAAVIAPLGLVGYLVWVGRRVGSTTGYFDVTNGWENGFDGGAAFLTWIGELLAGPSPVSGVLVVAGLGLLVWVLALCVKQRQPLPLVVFTVGLVALALTTSGYFGSKPRYLLPAFPLLFPPARWLAERRTGLAVTMLALVTAAAMAYGSVWLLGPGPP